MERPSRHRSHDKWKRIIEPAGDSDSSEWSSGDEAVYTDSDVGVRVSPFPALRLHDAAAGSSSSTNIARDQQQSPVNTSTSGNGQNKQLSSLLFRTRESYNSIFDPAGTTTKFDRRLPPPTNFNHLLHHDYAERDINNDRGTTETHMFHSPMFNPIIGPKRRWLFDSRSDPGSIMAIDCTTTTPSASANGSTTAVISDEPMNQDPENINIPSTSAANNIAENQDDERWRILSANRGIMSYSPPRKRPLFDPNISPVEPSGAGVNVVSVPVFCDVSVQGSSIQNTPTQSQAGLIDNTLTSSASLETERHTFPRAFLQVKNNANKEGRFDEGSSHSRENNSAHEDYSHTVPRSSDDNAEIQVLSMAGPSNRSSTILYQPRMHLTLQESTVPDDSRKSTHGLLSELEADNEGVEVIMVDEPQSESAAEKVQNVSSSSKQLQQQQQQLTTNQEQQATENEDMELLRNVRMQRIEDELLNQGLIGLLECPVCMEYMGPPIHQCRRGHLVCSACKPKLPSCPTCRSRFTESRNLAMEKVADKLHYPCKNAHMGCTTTLKLRDKDEHEANCIHRSYRCIMVPPCEWKGQHGEILPHVEQTHGRRLLQGPEHVLEMHLGDFTEQSSQNWIVSTLGELFRVNLGAVRGGRVQVFGCVLLLGPARRAPLFRYTLAVGPVKGDTAQRKMSYSRATHCYVERCSVYYSAGDSFHLRTESAQLFSSGAFNERVMHVNLRIEKIEP